MILRPTNGPLDWRDFLAKPDLHWKAGYSAMETAHSWERQQGLPPEIAVMFPNAELILAIPEYKVAIPGGARESQNDVFALLRDDKGLIPCMVEAKRNEPFGPTLGEWLTNAGQGKRDRLSAICGLLGLDYSKLDDSLRYQLFHRTASAVITAREFHASRAAMVVQSFSPEHRWFDDFTAFTALFNRSPDLNALETVDLPEGIELALGWAACSPKTEGSEA